MVNISVNVLKGDFVVDVYQKSFSKTNLLYRGYLGYFCWREIFVPFNKQKIIKNSSISIFITSLLNPQYKK